MTRYRVRFAKEIWGIPFVVADVVIRRARDRDRARRAAD